MSRSNDTQPGRAAGDTNVKLGDTAQGDAKQLSRGQRLYEHVKFVVHAINAVGHAVKLWLWLS